MIIDADDYSCVVHFALVVHTPLQTTG